MNKNGCTQPMKSEWDRQRMVGFYQRLRSPSLESITNLPWERKRETVWVNDLKDFRLYSFYIGVAYREKTRILRTKVWQSYLTGRGRRESQLAKNWKLLGQIHNLQSHHQEEPLPSLNKDWIKNKEVDLWWLQQDLRYIFYIHSR